MPTDQPRKVSLDTELDALIRTQVASGRYHHTGEVVRAGLRPLVPQTRQAGIGHRRPGRDRGAPRP